ncbi:beta-microseminoprotein A1 [Callorhinchus milii]|uniref:Beta-microseminoprotein A1-like n=1 Tax=Callorhinchus milii TaxID=7868 RepID=A0A4W3H6K6_CALMI|nr:beta-microseminoprotein A1 [Callorhinchus milii]|eukprot:gi/632987355/ref/XP_007910743.1/ PREDICTED: beta-microseminoprotein A1-like [Callorhinchus milii]
MNVLLCGALLIVWVPLSESACYMFPDHKEKQPIGSAKASDCIDPHDKSEHLTGTTWINSMCQTCSCVQCKTLCCDRVLLPRGYSEDCVATFNRKKCRYTVHQKENLSAQCKTQYYVGK